jgi:hypothetical protein
MTKKINTPGWLSASDPFFSQFSGTVDESGYVAGPYDSQIAGLKSISNWEAIAPQLGWTGPTMEDYIGPDGNNYTGYSPQFLNWVESKKAEGYDFVTDASQINKDRQTIGLRTPTGEVTNQQTVKVGGFGDFFKEFVLPSVGAYFGANALGNALAPVTNALTGGGAALVGGSADLIPGVMGGGQFSGAAAAPYTGVSGPGAISAGGALEGLGSVSGNIVGASGVPIAPAVSAPLIQDMAGNILNAVTGDVIVPAASSGAGLPPVSMPEITSLPSNIMGGGADVVGAGGDVAATEAAVPDRGFLGKMSETAATEGAGVSGTGVLTKGTNIPSAVLAGATGLTGIDLLDKAINFVSTPAGSAIVSGVGNVVGGIAAADAAKEAARTQAESADAATQLQRDIYNKFMEMNKPYYEAGVNALGQITRGQVTAEPGYGFRLGEGMKALERLQASRGNLLSGGALKAGQRFAQDLASEEYGRSFNRLAQIAGIGQNAAGAAGTAGQNFAGQAGELGMQGANALVSGRIGRTSAYTSGLQGAFGALQGYQQEQQRNQLMRDIFGRLEG